ncbi:MAG: EcsC family protein [Paracoccaceae bacterium]
MENKVSLPALLPDLSIEIAALAVRYRRAGGPLVALMNRLGGRIEAQMAMLPDSVRRQIEVVTAKALEQAHAMAAAGRFAPDLGTRAAPMVAALAGAAGGAGGIATSIVELPVTITLILHAIRGAAAAEGFDPDDSAIRAECLQVFAAGSPVAGDDGVNTAFLGARMTLTGPALKNLIAAVAPRLAAALGQKLAAQAVPVLGAASGAALNAAYLSYYRELARIRFALLRLAQTHGAEQVLAAFQDATTPKPITKA